MGSGPARVPEAWSRQPAGVATGEGSGWGRRGGVVAISLAIFRGALALSSSGAGLPSAGLEASVVGGAVGGGALACAGGGGGGCGGGGNGGGNDPPPPNDGDRDKDRDDKKKKGFFGSMFG